MKNLIRKTRKGSILVSSVILMMVLLLTGAAFLKWAADESLQANYDLARTQAYYVGQLGVLKEGWSFLRQHKITDLPSGTQNKPDGPWTVISEDDDRRVTARYHEVEIKNLEDNSSGSAFVSATKGYNISATGQVMISTKQGEQQIVERRVSLRAQLRTMANYMYLTDVETANPPDGSGDDVVWFYDGDTLYGRVHSNDYIGVKNRPIFYGPVSTCKDELREFNSNAEFEMGVAFEVPPVMFPDYANEVRNAAALGGNFFDNNDGQLQTQIEGTPNGYHLVQWPVGSSPEPIPEIIVTDLNIGYGLNVIVFVEGQLLIKGNAIKQRSTISSEGNMYLIDNVKYADVPTNNPIIPEGSNNILGLISESNVVIANTFENGRDNGASETEDFRKDIIITAGIVALNESFTFENQNDFIDTQTGRQPIVADWDRGGYLYNNCDSRDLRGYIYMRGAVAQRRRGYVRRSNCGGTGYDKQYSYDFRLQTNPPPVYLTAQDDDGNVFFDITSSWDHKPGSTNVR